jgi:hypothetical protein
MPELLNKRTATSKVFSLPDAPDGRKRFAIDSSISQIHYKDVQQNWQDIDTSFSESDTGQFSAKFTKLPYHLRVGNDSRRRIYPDRNDLSYWIELQKPFTSMGTPVKTGNQWVWDFPNATVKITIGGGALKFNAILKNAAAPTSLTFPFTVQGITRNGNELLHNGQVVAVLRKPVAVDANGVERDLTVTWAAGQVTLSLNTAGLAFPIDIDPTIDVDGAAGADDGESNDAGTGWYSNSGSSMKIGWSGAHSDRFNSWMRFTGISGLSGATIDVAYMRVRGYDTTPISGTPLTKVLADDQAAPSAPTTAGDHAGRTRTTAGVDWDMSGWGADSWNNSPSIVSVIQELADSYNPTVIQILHDDDGSSSSGTNVVRLYTYDTGASNAPELHIEYTAGGTAFTPKVIFM